MTNTATTPVSPTQFPTLDTKHDAKAAIGLLEIDFYNHYQESTSDRDSSENSSIQCENNGYCFCGKCQYSVCMKSVERDNAEVVRLTNAELGRDTELGRECKRNVTYQKTWSDLDTGWSWVVMGACFGGQTICTGLLYTTGLIHIALLNKFRADDAQTTWASAIFISMTSFAGPLSSILADRYGCRTAFVVSGLTAATGFFLSAFAPNIETCIFSIGVIAGSGVGMAYTILFTVNAYNFREKLNIAQGMSISGSGFGILVLPPLIQLARDRYGFAGLMLILAGVVLQLIVFGTLMRPSKLELRAIEKRVQDSLEKGDTKGLRCGKVLVFLKVLSRKATTCLSTSMFLFCGGLYTVTLQLPNCAQSNGFTAMQSALFLSIIGVVAMIGRLITGMLAQHPRINEMWIYSGSIGMLSLVTFLFPAMARAYGGHIFFSVCIGVFGGSCYVVINTINKIFVGIKYVTAACAVEFWFGGLGSVAIPVISGYVIASSGQYSHVFFLGASCILLSAITGGIPAFLKTPVAEDVLEIEISDQTPQLQEDGRTKMIPIS